MSSLYGDLSEKLDKDPGLTKRGGARHDIGLLLFDFRDSLRDLWLAADAEVGVAAGAGDDRSESLRAAVENLRPLFGERRAD